MKLKTYKDLRAHLALEVQEWQKHLTQAYETYPRLLFLGQRQLSQLLKYLKLVIIDKPQRDGALHKLHPFLFLCFPDVLKWDITEESQQEWEQAIQALLHDKEDRKSFIAGFWDKLDGSSSFYLDVAGQITKDLEEKLDILPGRPKGQLPQVVNACGFNASKLLRLHMTLDDNPLHPSQVGRPPV